MRHFIIFSLITTFSALLLFGFFEDYRQGTFSSLGAVEITGVYSKESLSEKEFFDGSITVRLSFENNEIDPIKFIATINEEEVESLTVRSVRFSNDFIVSFANPFVLSDEVTIKIIAYEKLTTAGTERISLEEKEISFSIRNENKIKFLNPTKHFEATTFPNVFSTNIIVDMPKEWILTSAKGRLNSSPIETYFLEKISATEYKITFPILNEGTLSVISFEALNEETGETQTIFNKEKTFEDTIFKQVEPFTIERVEMSFPENLIGNKEKASIRIKANNREYENDEIKLIVIRDEKELAIKPLRYLNGFYHFEIEAFQDVLETRKITFEIEKIVLGNKEEIKINKVFTRDVLYPFERVSTASAQDFFFTFEDKEVEIVFEKPSKEIEITRVIYKSDGNFFSTEQIKKVTKESFSFPLSEDLTGETTFIMVSIEYNYKNSVKSLTYYPDNEKVSTLNIQEEQENKKHLFDLKNHTHNFINESNKNNLGNLVFPEVKKYEGFYFDEVKLNIIENGVFKEVNIPSNFLEKNTTGDYDHLVFLLNDYFDFLSNHKLSQRQPFSINEVVFVSLEYIYTNGKSTLTHEFSFENDKLTFGPSFSHEVLLILPNQALMNHNEWSVKNSLEMVLEEKHTFSVKLNKEDPEFVNFLPLIDNEITFTFFVDSKEYTEVFFRENAFNWRENRTGFEGDISFPFSVKDLNINYEEKTTIKFEINWAIVLNSEKYEFKEEYYLIIDTRAGEDFENEGFTIILR